MPFDIKSNPHADVVELADALASGASGSNLVRVQVPPSAPVFIRLSRSGIEAAFLLKMVLLGNIFIFLKC